MIFNQSSRKKVFILLLLIVLIIVALYAFTAGNYDISLKRIIMLIGSKLGLVDAESIEKLDEVIIWNIRTPRIIMAVIVGVALSSAGVAYQGCFRNPLVEPYILGVSAGAAFGATVGILFPHFFMAINISAFVFSTIAVSLSYFLAKSRATVSTVGLVLSGVIIGSIFTAMVSILKYLSDDTQLREITFWIMGGLYYASWKDIGVALIVVTIAFILMWVFSWKLNILSMGDEEARSLGINPEKYKAIYIISATLMTAICVASVGIIAWVGLMMPHASRLLLGPDNRYVMPASAIMGAIYMIICDTIARTLTAGEIPIGIITSLLGAPFLIWLLRKRANTFIA